MCYKLDRKRTKKFKRKTRFRKRNNDFSRIRSQPYESHYKKSNSQTEPDNNEEILNLSEFTASNQKDHLASITLPTPINDRHSEIRKLVKEKMSDGTANEPLLESLYFITDEAEFAYVDFDPFLLAVEFALQGKMVLVEGHTDDRGDRDHNLKLSMKRVRQIETLMHDIGVPPQNVSVIGYGESIPKYDNSTEEGRQKNRRVDFKIF